MEANADPIKLSRPSAPQGREPFREVCPVERALDAIGTRSAFAVLREAFYGTRRFEDFVHCTGLTEQMTATRLKQLVEAEILAKQPYKTPGQRTRYEYVLTGRGLHLFPLVVGMIEFGMLLQGDARQWDLVHGDGCGARLMTQVQCVQGHPVELAHAEARVRASV
jgi:DNA-binding HxlR family transcriptional regulator